MISAEKFLETMVEKARMDPREIRATLKDLPTDGLVRLLRFCQERAGRDLPRRSYGLVHQDIVNILGERLGFTVEFGDYEKGPDGIWSYGGVKIIVESKTSSAWLQIRQVHDYVREHNASSGLAIAPEFTDDNLMAARSYGDVRLLTTDGLGRLLELKEEGRLTTEALVKILVPVESVKLDYFIDVIYAIAKPGRPLEKPVEKPEAYIPPTPKPRIEGEITPQKDYEMPILESLIEMGGSGKARDVLEKVYEKMKERLRPMDLEKLPSGEVRWMKSARWERQRLVSEGYIKKDSPQGIWEITDKGVKYYEERKRALHKY